MCFCRGVGTSGSTAITCKPAQQSLARCLSPDKNTTIFLQVLNGREPSSYTAVAGELLRFVLQFLEASNTAFRIYFACLHSYSLDNISPSSLQARLRNTVHQ